MLEKNIADLTAVIKELIEKLESGELTVKSPAKAPATKKAEPEAEAKKEPAKKDNVEPLKKVEPAKAKTPTKDDLREALFDMQKAYDREIMLALVAEAADGAQTIMQVPEGCYQKVIDACTAKLAELAEAA